MSKGKDISSVLAPVNFPCVHVCFLLAFSHVTHEPILGHLGLTCAYLQSEALSGSV